MFIYVYLYYGQSDDVLTGLLNQFDMGPTSRAVIIRSRDVQAERATRGPSPVLVARLRAKRLGLKWSPAPPRPNTELRFPFFDPTSRPTIKSPLSAAVWRSFLHDYPDEGTLSTALVGAIEHGALLAYEGTAQSPRLGKQNLKMTVEECAAVNEEVLRRSREGGLVTVDLSNIPKGFIASPLGAVKKPSVNGVKKFRTIHHLSHPRNFTRPGQASVNAGINIDKVTLVYESIEGIFDQIRDAHDHGISDLALWKVDLKDAYRHVVLAWSVAPLLGFYWEGQYYHDTVLSFGGRSAPFVFNLFGEGAQWILQSLGIDTFRYLDDFFGLVSGTGRTGKGDAVERVEAVVQFATGILTELGFSISPGKCVKGPVIEILGIMVDATRATAWVTGERRAKLEKDLRRYLKRKSATLNELESLAGTICFFTKVCPLGRAFVSRIFAQIADHRRARGIQKRCMKGSCLSKLRWWSATLETWPGKRLLTRQDTIHLWTDASGSLGIGGVLGSTDKPIATFSLRTPARHVSKDIMFKEAYAVLHAIVQWGRPHLEGRAIKCHIDNQALAASLRSGSCKSPNSQALICRIYTLLAALDCDLVTEWLPSASNEKADKLSRISILDATILTAPEYLDNNVEHEITLLARDRNTDLDDHVGCQQNQMVDEFLMFANC